MFSRVNILTKLFWLPTAHHLRTFFLIFINHALHGAKISMSISVFVPFNKFPGQMFNSVLSFYSYILLLFQNKKEKTSILRARTSDSLLRLPLSPTKNLPHFLSGNIHRVAAIWTKPIALLLFLLSLFFSPPLQNTSNLHFFTKLISWINTLFSSSQHRKMQWFAWKLSLIYKEQYEEFFSPIYMIGLLCIY